MLQTEKALQVALEASQSEAAALKLAYQYSNDKYVELKGTYEELLEQLKEEVGYQCRCYVCGGYSNSSVYGMCVTGCLPGEAG